MMLSEEMKNSFQLRVSAITDLSRDAFFFILVHYRCSAHAEERVENADNFPHCCFGFFFILLRANIACISHGETQKKSCKYLILRKERKGKEKESLS